MAYRPSSNKRYGVKVMRPFNIPSVEWITFHHRDGDYYLPARLGSYDGIYGRGQAWCNGVLVSDWVQYYQHYPRWMK